MSRRVRFGAVLAGLVLALACDSGEDDPSMTSVSWGPSFFGVASDVDDSGAAADVALGVLWDGRRISLTFNDATCFVVHTRKRYVVGIDPGEVIVHGGSGQAEQPLTRNDQGYYYLDGEPDPWHEGDSVSVEADGQTYGPAEIPSDLADSNLLSLAGATRNEDLVIEADGSTGELLGLSIAADDDVHSYMGLCTSQASSGKIVVPAAALATFPAALGTLHLKLQGANATNRGGVGFLAAGPSISTDLPFE